MKRPALPLLMLLLPVLASGQNQPFELYGTITGQYNNKAYLFFDRDYKHRDSVDIKDGHFYFKGKASLPVLGRLSVGDGLLQDVYIDSKVTCVTCTNAISVVATTKDTFNRFFIVKVKGSTMDQLRRDMEAWLTRLKASPATEAEKKQATYDKLYAFVHQYPHSKLSLYLIGKAERLDYAQLDTLNKLVDSTLNNTYEAKTVVQWMHIQDKSKHKAIGSPFLDVALKDTAGRVLRTADWRGKYLLVDVWASWCKPCRDSNPGLKVLFDKFRAKEFDLLSISIDQDAAQWKAAILQDGLPWSQVRDQDHSWSDEMGISGIPQTFLVDKAGKIIAVGLTAWELEAMLTKLL